MKREFTDSLIRNPKETKKVNIKDYFNSSPKNKSFKTMLTIPTTNNLTNFDHSKSKEEPFDPNSNSVFDIFNTKKNQQDDEFKIFDILVNEGDNYATEKKEEEKGVHTLRICDFRHIYKEVQIFSKQSFQWLENEIESLKDNRDPFLRNMKFFLSYHCFNSTKATPDFIVFEVLSSCLKRFIRNKKNEFKLINENFEIYGFHDIRVLERGLNSQDIDKLKKFSAFLVYKVKNNNYVFKESLMRSGVDMIKLNNEELSKKEDEYVITGKQISLVFQMLIDFFLSGKSFFELFSNFQFINSVYRNNDIHYKKNLESDVILNVYNVLGSEMKQSRLKRHR